ncbi:hypothetical protein N0V82_005331 [Gnomoniopsis sp. IMI 355080]|nr:hypothetical protein N0V82_005331 [Gnomoniopsis sp. IMI 355080]
MLYSGVSNRSRGWKSKKSGDLWPMDNRLVRQPSLRKFDGAARSCTAWDHLRKDPELWLRDGNCFVHLYEKGQSSRGPAFRILFASLLSAQCLPLIERFVDRAVSEEEAYQNGRVDLYIPAPAAASRSEAAQYHLIIRNFFAWVARRSVVGRHLGNALIGLTNAMEEFREPDADNVHDLFAYLDEEGYLDMRNQPEHALAILHLSEVFEIRELYIDAFAHCVGMSEHLYKHHEYSPSSELSPKLGSPMQLTYMHTIQRISVASRKLIRRARVDMDFRLSRAGAMLSDLLKEELSEAHVGLSTGARAHLDQFRAYIHAFYTTRFGGRFPPSAADPRWCTVFPPNVYCSMRADFEALYQYLVDETYNITNNTDNDAPSVMAQQGGLCALQSVHEFDLRHNFPPLDHPLPHLPELVKAKESRRRRSMLWLQGSVVQHHHQRSEGKLRPEQRLLVHAALMRATNHTNTDLLENSLVLAYRQFEQDSVMVSQKGKRSDKHGVTPGDARKVRWLFIYAMYQTLRSCTQVPMEVKDTDSVPYHLGVSTKSIPPWQTPANKMPHDPASDDDEDDDGSPASSSTPQRAATQRRRSIGAVPLLSSIPSPPPEERGGCGFEIKPDIDYFALTHQQEETIVQPASPTRGRGRVLSGGTSTPRSRSQSLTRSTTLRRSLSIFRTPSQRQRRRAASMNLLVQPSPASGMNSMMYHEIIVHGYGNGTNSVTEETATTVPSLPPPPPTTLSQPQLTVVTNTTTTTTPTTTASRSASTSSTNSFVSALSSCPSLVAQSLASTTPTTLMDPNSPISPTTSSSRQLSDSWAQTSTTTTSTTSTTSTTTTTSCTMLARRPSYDQLTFPMILRRGEEKSITSPRKRGIIRDMYSNDDMLAAAMRSEPPPLPRRSSKRFMRGLAAVASPPKRWSLVNVTAELRENVSSSGSEEDEEAKLQQQYMGNNNTTTTTTTTLQGAMDTSLDCRIRHLDVPRDEEHEDDEDDWEKSTLTLSMKEDVSPPCAWEQFTDLGGLQPIHLLG